MADLAPDGEVEDYPVTILPATSSTGTGLIDGTANSILGFSQAAYLLSTVYAADLDNDGDLDSLTAAFGGGIAWQKNDGLNNGFKRILE